MKKFLFMTLGTVLLAGCDTFGYAPQPFPVWSPIPSRTPGIVSPTPIIHTLTANPFPSATSTGEILPSETPTPTETPISIPPSVTNTPPAVQSVGVEILGCNTSLDLTHGMGEVTNAFVTVKNTGDVDLPHTCSLLRAADEHREHPDKRVCVATLPVGHQVTLKLTVDSAYKQDTAIQIDTASNETLLLRVDRSSCTDIGLFGGTPPDLGIIKPSGP